MSKIARNILVAIIISSSTLSFLLVYHWKEVDWNPLRLPLEASGSNSSRFTLQEIDTNTSRSQLDNANIYVPWHKANDDIYFERICSKNLTIPSPKLSQLHLEKFEDGIAEVSVHVAGQAKNTISASDDVIFVWAEQINGEGRVSGTVQSNGNGSYKGYVKPFWRGKTRIKAKIAGSSVNACLRYRSLLRYGNAAYSMKTPLVVFGIFQNRSLRDKTRCGTIPHVYGHTDVCNFTRINDRSPWYCGKPQNHNISCQHIYSFSTATVLTNSIREQEKIQNPVHGTLGTTVTIDSKIGANQLAKQNCTNAPKRESWTRTSISGFRGPKVWEPLHCKGPSEHTDAYYTHCLKGKNLVFIGDSQIRQYFEYIARNVLRKAIPNWGNHNIGPNRTFNDMTVLSSSNITAYFRKHEMPWHMDDAPPKGIKSTVSWLKELATNDLPGYSLVIAVNYFSHFMAFPTSQYRQRINKLVMAVKYLLAKKPDVTIFCKGPAVVTDSDRWFDNHFALLSRDILFEEFRDVMDSVLYLDTWDITIAHDSEHLHPVGKCMQSQIQQMMAYMCK